mgnify:CR=1
MVYLLQNTETKNLKIGYCSHNNSKSRAKACQTYSENEIVCLYDVPGDISLERYFHEKFKNLRIRNEWFKFSEEIITEFENRLFCLKNSDKYIDMVLKKFIKLEVCGATKGKLQFKTLVDRIDKLNHDWVFYFKHSEIFEKFKNNFTSKDYNQKCEFVFNLIKDVDDVKCDSVIYQEITKRKCEHYIYSSVWPSSFIVLLGCKFNDDETKNVDKHYIETNADYERKIKYAHDNYWLESIEFAGIKNLNYRTYDESDVFECKEDMFYRDIDDNSFISNKEIHEHFDQLNK